MRGTSWTEKPPSSSSYLILLHPTVGVVIFNAIKFESASGETNGGIASPEEKKRELVAGGQESKDLDVIRYEELLVFGVAERACDDEACEMEQIAAVVNLRRLASVKMNN